MANTKSLASFLEPSGVSISTYFGWIATRREWKWALISPLLIRFSMFGLIQYFTRSEIPAPRWSIVTRAPVQNSSSAAMAAEFFAHDQHVVIVVRVRLLVIMDYLVQLFTGHVEHV